MIVMTPQDPTSQETIEALLNKAQRIRVPFRNTFVQIGKRSKTKPGKMATLIRHRDERGLDLYLLIMAVAAHEPYVAKFDAGVWARALGPHGSVSAAVVSRALGRLEDLKLISRRRVGRKVAITVLNEDGSGDPYTRPVSKEDPWFQLPVEYWLDGWHRKLPLVAKAMLLIALSLPEPFTLAADKAQEWYGISADTVERGFAKLEESGLLDKTWTRRKAPLTGRGYVMEYRRRLLPPFDRATRKRRRKVVERKGVKLEVMTATPS
jgi:DNA-binding transcriptional ArsR family regulator